MIALCFMEVIKMGQKATQRICYDLDRGVFQNDTLDGPALNGDGCLADQDKIREELHEEYEEAGLCHIYKGKKYCYCGGKCVDWATLVIRDLNEAYAYEFIRQIHEDGEAFEELKQEILKEKKTK